MWCILIPILFCLVNPNFSSLITQNEFLNHRQVRLQPIDNHGETANCPKQPINIDTPRNKLVNRDQKQNYVSIEITSSGKQVVEKTDEGDSEETDDHSLSSNAIQVIFKIPYQISNESILNQTVFITDTTNNQLIVPLTYICFHGSSFVINYSTNKSLPHNVCLYLLLNMTFTKEIFLCRTIEKNILFDDHESSEDHTVGPSVIFVILQSVIVCLMMLIIFVVQTATKKRFVHRIGQHLFRNKLPTPTTNIDTLNDTRNSEITNENYFILSPTEEEILAAADLTSVRNDRRLTNHTLIDITELTRRLDISHKDTESYTF